MSCFSVLLAHLAKSMLLLRICSIAREDCSKEMYPCCVRFPGVLDLSEMHQAHKLTSLLVSGFATASYKLFDSIPNSSRKGVSPGQLLSTLILPRCSVPELLPSPSSIWQWKQHEGRDAATAKGMESLALVLAAHHRVPWGDTSQSPLTHFMYLPCVTVQDQEWEGLHSTFHLCSMIVLQFKLGKVTKRSTGVSRRQD